MKKISLVCTIHEECGLANAGALYSILCHIQPQVIFFECPVDVFDDFIITGARSNLESIVIREYIKNNGDVFVIPVDLPTPENQFFEKHKQFIQRIEWKSPDYRRLMLWNTNYIIDYGFPYLNNAHSDKIWFEIYSAIRATVQMINDWEVTEFLNLWERINDFRENEWMKNILKYCASNSFERSVFMVGAAHRKAIIDKSQSVYSASKFGVQWDFVYDQSQFGRE